MASYHIDELHICGLYTKDEIEGSIKEFGEDKVVVLTDLIANFNDGIKA